MKALILIVIVSLLSSVDVARAATTYEYDDLGRLTKAKCDNGKEIDYSYDPAGNRGGVVTQNSPPHASLARPPKKLRRARHR